MNQHESNEHHKSKKKIRPLTIVLIGILALVLGFTGFIIYKRYFSKEKTVNLLNRKKTENLVTNDLDGTKVAAEKAKRHPLAIMVENHPESRPQTGLDKASIVYEAITEGGITRFMAIYGPQDSEKVGPVRSARTYYIDWLSEFNAFYAHVGGNLDALDKIKADNILDLDQFALGEKAYWREPEAGKAIEHTMYTSINKLYDYAFNDKKWPKESSFKSLVFKAPMEEKLRPAGQNIEIPFSSASYAVNWEYDTQTNKYLRSMGGNPHKDKETGEQLAATNIVIQQMERREATTAINENGWAMDTIGTDKAIIFSQGKQITGTWKKLDRTSRTLFYDDKGKEISFTPGQFWVEIVPPDVFSDIKVEALTAKTTTDN